MRMHTTVLINHQNCIIFVSYPQPPARQLLSKSMDITYIELGSTEQYLPSLLVGVEKYNYEHIATPT